MLWYRAFADNVKEEKKVTKVVVKTLSNRSSTEIVSEEITMLDGGEAFYTIPIAEGYRFDRYDTSDMTDCVLFNEHISGTSIRFEAQRIGTAVLRIILVSEDGAVIIIELYIEVILGSKG